MTTDVHVDTKTIHRFDPPPEHRGGAGVCGLMELDSGKKQGAYGKVTTISVCRSIHIHVYIHVQQSCILLKYIQ
jgi:hypothetical protein